MEKKQTMTPEKSYADYVWREPDEEKEVGLVNAWVYDEAQDILCDHDYARSVAELAPNIRFCCFCGEKL